MVADLANAFLDGSGGFQHDYAPCHKANEVMDYMKKIKIMVMVARELPKSRANLEFVVDN